MLLDIGFLDDATRPAPIRLEGLTEAQRAPGLHLKEVHDHLRDNMKTLAVLIDRAAAGEVGAKTATDEAAGLAMVANYRRFGNLCGQHCNIVNVHHSIEDEAVFPAIAAQGAGFKAIADRLRAEHVVVHQLLVRLIDTLGELAAAPGPGRFADTLEIYRALERVLLSHLGYEEEAIGDALGYFELF
ncbi:hemerythrin domain-containing protein [Devosia sp. LjRoot16]|uniref:hemerythrin domain-containing protein n=1 Tax=Devosia sp. LjRoot16 TaxID=3342271 RepID=UPI003ECFF445